MSPHTNASILTGYILWTFTSPTNSITIYTQISFVASAVLWHVASPLTFVCKPKSQLLQVQGSINYVKTYFKFNSLHKIFSLSSENHLCFLITPKQFIHGCLNIGSLSFHIMHTCKYRLTMCNLVEMSISPLLFKSGTVPSTW